MRHRLKTLSVAAAASLLAVTGLALAACGSDNSDGTPPVHTRGDQYAALSWDCPDGTKVYISEEGWSHGDDPEHDELHPEPHIDGSGWSESLREEVLAAGCELPDS